ncbi:hypothetical protein [Alicyclobacillus ferrooxydans]|uniref:Uncharacterized protein n=1 Tax=Alicyclobacillus ferrooxydans TaxID=471514 RepID=A0A0P9EHC0_9BACL|nr:hypothetical protein [Alicyclobacillus ferrooxydans]KPV42007.1 hypothetical protein AN477_19755 [Alicyclobacillus ferrooxydans]
MTDSVIAKPVIDDIEAAGYKVLTRAEYAGLQRLYEAVKNWRYGLIDKQTKGDVGSIAAAYPAIYRLATTFDELEAMNT